MLDFTELGATKLRLPRANFSEQTTALGIRVYGVACIVLGFAQIYFGEFAAVWQPVQPGVPARQLLAYLTGIIIVLAGVAVQTPRARRIGALILAVVYSAFALLWLPRVIGFPQIFATWGGLLQQLSLASVAVITMDLEAKFARIACAVFGISVLSFGLGHFFAIPQTAELVPRWMPPGQSFWAIATGVAFVLAAIALLSGERALLASRLLTIMLLLFGALIWAPSLWYNPHIHTVWAGNAVNLGVAGAAWIVADWLRSTSDIATR